MKRCMCYIGLVVAALLCWACSSDDASRPSDSGTRLLPMSMTICLQPDADMTDGTPDGSATRATGDPGTLERFAFPAYFYVYAVGFTAADGAYPESQGGTVCPMTVMDGSTEVEVNRITVGSDPSLWRKYHMYVDPPQTYGDSIYGSTQNVSFKVPTDIVKMRFYVAASPVPLKYGGKELGVREGDDDLVLKASNNESDVLGLRFDVENNLQDRLQDVYSSPYNYCPSAAPYHGLYYYTIPSPNEAGEVTGDIVSSDITRIIYHVAAKADVKWNVVTDCQADNRITYVEARKLKKKNCLLFRPTENTWDSDDEADNYAKVLLNGDVGRQWYGRQPFYTILYKNEGKFDVNLHILRNGDDLSGNAASGYNLRHRHDLSGSNYSIFVPWVRSDLRFTHDITYGNVTK